MKKTDKKIISIFLVLIILISQFSTIIFAGDYYDYMYDLSLEQYLISIGVDEDGNKKISDEEWKKVKNLDLRDYGSIKTTDLTGIEKAVNLKMLRVIRADLSKIDFSKLVNLKELYIDECSLKDVEISGLNKLTTLKIYDSNLENCKIEKLKNLELSIGYSSLNNCKIENIENFESATFTDLNMEKIDLTKIKNVKKLYINLYSDNMTSKIDFDFTEFKNLEILHINDENPYEYYSDKKEYVNEYLNIVNNINISGLSNLKELYLYDTYNCNIDFSGLNNIEIFDVDNDKIESIDFTNYEKLEKATISKFKETLGKEDVKISKDFIATVEWKTGDCYSLVLKKEERIVEFKSQRNIFINSNIIDFLEILPGEDDILKFEKNGNYWYLVIQGFGEQKVKFTDALEREHEFLIKVVANNVVDINTELENTGITAESIAGSLILKSNGELWDVNSETTAEMLDKNVKKYVSYEVYLSSENYRGMYYSTLYNDDKLIINYFEENKKVINNVKDIGESLYLTNDGKLYEYSFCYVTEECKIKLVADNMEKIIDEYSYWRQFIISKDGNTFEKKRNGSCTKILDVEVNEYKESVKNETADGVEYVEMLIDINGNKWINYNGGWRIADKDDNLIERSYYKYGRHLTLSENKTAHVIYRGTSEEEILAAPLILTDVEYIIDCFFDENTDVLIRSDGSIWTYSLSYGLIKITESTPGKEEKLKIDFEDVSEEEGIISDIKIGTTIDDLKAKIKTNGDVKVYTKDGVLIEKNEKLATGMKVEISLGNEQLFYTIAIEGDCNGDGKVRVGDLTTMMVSVAENLASNKDTSKILDGAWKQAVDFNGDGKLNVSDITKIKILIAESK